MLYKTLPCYEELDEILSYDEETGIFTWKVSPSRAVKAGDVAGGFNLDGYRVIGYRGNVWLEHRLAWLMSVGEDPVKLIDHIDANKSNNRIDNLRLLDYSKNLARAFDPCCCAQQASGRYQAVYTLDSTKYYLGTYDTKEEASRIGRAARREARGI